MATINCMTFQGQEVWRQVEKNYSMDKVTMGATGVHVFNKAEDVCQFKWPLVTHLALNWQLTSLACKVES